MITVAVLLKLPQLIKQLEQISNNQKGSATKRIHHSVWKNVLLFFRLQQEPSQNMMIVC